MHDAANHYMDDFWVVMNEYLFNCISVIKMYVQMALKLL